jgi:hypothetical protein
MVKMELPSMKALAWLDVFEKVPKRKKLIEVSLVFLME